MKLTAAVTCLSEIMIDISQNNVNGGSSLNPLHRLTHPTYSGISSSFNRTTGNISDSDSVQEYDQQGVTENVHCARGSVSQCGGSRKLT
eukprot:2386966-Rhodomonas_salina.2